jgi:methylenetetrahydrofolate dehydrogenase (NADP+) / methenyltetrahydrofolate cyclohydrolase
MTQLLLGVPVAEQLFSRTHDAIQKDRITGYLAIFMIGENHPGRAYVRKKVEYAEKLELQAKVFTNESTIDADLESCNMDKECLWIIIQLPLPATLQDRKVSLLNAVHSSKDVDCLWEQLISMSTVGDWSVDVIPATPAAVMHLLAYYDLEKIVPTSIVSILWESDLIWAPLAALVQTMWANVHTFNEFSNQDQMRSICKASDIIIAATGNLHLVDETFVRADQKQIVIDVGRGMLDGKSVGDVKTEQLMDKVYAITPVPWWVWPVTVASLFRNLVRLRQQRVHIADVLAYR